MNLREAANLMAERLTRLLPAREVWLFGSVARGEEESGSDIDLLAVVEESSQPEHRRAQEAHRLLADIGVPKDVVVLTRHEWARQRTVVNTLPYIAERQGILLAKK